MNFVRISSPGGLIRQIDISVTPGQTAAKIFEDANFTRVRIYNADGTPTTIVNEYQHLADGTISGSWDWLFESSTLTGV